MHPQKRSACDRRASTVARAMTKIIKRMMHGAVSSAFWRWCENVQETRRMAVKASKMGPLGPKAILIEPQVPEMETIEFHFEAITCHCIPSLINSRKISLIFSSPRFMYSERNLAKSAFIIFLRLSIAASNSIGSCTSSH